MFSKYLMVLTALLLVAPSFNYAQEKVKVEGAMVIGNSEDATPEAGTIRWTGTDFEGWTGTEWVSLTSGPCGGLTLVRDVDANNYRIVAIGNQCWMADNLRVTKYNDGTLIPNVIGTTDWNTVTTPAYSWYSDMPGNATPYGALYNWYALDTLSNGNKNACPSGWHLPSQDEYMQLTGYLGGELVAGIKLKTAGNVHFEDANETATNTSGFTAIPGGYRTGTSFFEKGYYAQYWTTTAAGSTMAVFLDIQYDGEYASLSDQDKKRGNSVRCVKD